MRFYQGEKLANTNLLGNAQLDGEQAEFIPAGDGII